MIDVLFAQILSFDRSLIEQAVYLHTPLLDEIMKIFTALWDFWVIWIVIICLCFAIREHRLKTLFLIEWMCINILLWEGLLKHLFHRARPFESIDTIQLLIPSPLTTSFPSGHTSTSIAFAILFSWLFWKQNRFFVGIVWILALGISFSRFYLQVHYPSDILVGVVLGGVSAWAVMVLAKYILKKNDLIIQ